MEHTFGDFATKRTIIPTGNTGYTNGYYLFDEFPDKNSLKPFKTETTQTLDFGNLNKSWFDLAGEGDRIEKYKFGCRFGSVSQSFYNVLLEFARLQDEGLMVNIHPNIDDLPPIMTGKFKLSGYEKNSWDVSLRSFNFEFQEM